MTRLAHAHATVLATVLLAATGCTPPDDRTLGAAAAEVMDRRVTFHPDLRAQAALARLGAPLVRASGDTAYAWRFRLVVDTSLNAFALPGGYVYVHTGLVSAASDPAELGGVLGHEIAHAVLRHGARQAAKRQRLALAVGTACLLTGWCSGGLGSLAADLGTAAAASRFSREDELQADSAGVRYAEGAGLDPRGVARFFRRLEARREASPAILQFLATHPMEAERIARVERLAGPANAAVPDSAEAAFRDLRTRIGAGG